MFREFGEQNVVKPSRNTKTQAKYFSVPESTVQLKSIVHKISVTQCDQLANEKRIGQREDTVAACPQADTFSHGIAPTDRR
jgi:hypothetical protein